MTKKSGFTIVEIMICVAIVGILVAIAVPGFQEARRRQRLQQETAKKAIIKSVLTPAGASGYYFDLATVKVDDRAQVFQLTLDKFKKDHPGQNPVIVGYMIANDSQPSSATLTKQ